jgi:hypothetical protein
MTIFLLICLLLIQVVTSADPIHKLIGNHLDSEVVSDRAVPAVDSVFTILLQKPQHRFHSDHWFHMAEYYLSNSNRTSSIFTGIKSAAINSAANHLSCIRSPSVVIIVAPEDSKFLKKLTKVAFFVLILSFTDERTQTVFIVGHDHKFAEIEPSDEMPSMNLVAQFHQRISSSSKADTASYDNTKPFDKQFLVQPADKSAVASVQNKLSLALIDNTCKSSTEHLSAGGIPMDSGKWFTSTDQVVRMRKNIVRLCSSCNTDHHDDDLSSTIAVEVQAKLHLLREAQPGILVSRKINGLFLPLPAASTQPFGDYVKDHAKDNKKGNDSSKSNDQHFNMLVYERDSNRRFQDLEGLLTFLSQHTDTNTAGNGNASITWNLDVLYHSDDMHPCLLYLALGQADIFLTTHGFQSTALLFMKRGAVLIEVFPYKYFKPSYIRLSATYGIHHRWIQNSQPTSVSRQGLRLISIEACMKRRKCRSHARGDSVQVTPLDLLFILNVTRDVESGVLGSHNAPEKFQ